MKKIKHIVIGLMILMILSAGCANEYENNKETYTELGLNIEDCEMPKEETEKAKIYEACFWEAEEDTMLEALFDGKEVRKEIQAYSVAYYYEDKQEKTELLLHDGGEASGEKGGLDGGFSYNTEKEEWHMNSIQCSYLTDMYPGYMEKEGMDVYPKACDRDLAFQKFTDAEQNTKKELEVFGVTDLKLADAYSITKESMQEKMDCLDEETKQEIFDNFEIREEDECYIMIYNQMLDGIPIVDVYWPEEPRDVGEAPETYVAVRVSKYGIVSMEAEGLYVWLGKGDEKQLIPFEEALDKIKKRYEYSSNADLKSIQLVYVSIKKDDKYELIPAWFFEVEEEQKFQTGSGETLVEKEIVYYAVHAVTGEIMGKNG